MTKQLIAKAATVVMIFAASLLGMSSALAQNAPIRGTVVDSGSQPVIGAAVLVPGTTNGATTDIKMNRKFLLAQLNHEKVAAGELNQAEWAGLQAKAAYDSIAALTDIYNHQLDGCMSVSFAGCPTRLDGIGYDWVSAEITDLSFDLPAIPADSVTVHIWMVPFWPLYEGVGNRYSIALDGSDPVVISNDFVEYADSWKDQVLQNGHEAVVSLPLDRSAKKHVLRLQAVDPGQIVERIVIDWGGLKPSYVGPSSGSL